MLKLNFDEFKGFFEGTQLWKHMVDTTENSSWHREPSVAIHTNMVLEEFEKINIVENFNSLAATVARLALLFHDVGKPAAKIEKYSEERGHYNAFHGHEIISAREMENFICENFVVLKNILYINDWYPIYAAMWFIENHLPYDLKKPDRRAELRVTVSHFEAELCAEGLFAAILRADARGRISDDHEDKLKRVEAWIEEFYKLTPTFSTLDGDKILILPVGASGSGKTTLRNALKEMNDSFYHFSWDELRKEFAAEHINNFNDLDSVTQAQKAFKLTAMEKPGEFSSFQQAKFTKLLNSLKTLEKVTIFVDNTNTSRKSRQLFITAARRYGFKVIAYIFPISRHELLKRSNDRNDHKVPDESIMRQWNNISLPAIGEVDELNIIKK